MPKHASGKLRFYTSNLLDQHDLKHGFFTRLGGVSTGPYVALNIKAEVGDSPANAATNRALMCQALGQNPGRLVIAKLALGAKVEVITNEPLAREIADTDALLTNLKGMPLSVSVADCLPIIIYDPRQQALGVIHVGWRGLAANIIGQTVQKFIKNYHSNPRDVIAALGPAIAVDSYQVGPDVLNAMSQIFTKNSGVIIAKNGRTYCDLRLGAQIQLNHLKIRKIDHIDIDTYTNTKEIYSYRAEGQTGRFGVVASQ